MPERKIKRYYRYLRYTLQWIFLEKLRGLDFSMRDLSLLNQTGGVFHGYSKTDEKHAKEIFNALNVDKKKRLLDVGCGKGAFLYEATKADFGRVAGLEYVRSLSEIAERNFKRLHLSDKVEVVCGNATCFNNYADFNVFYFFNPFDESIMEKVMDKIVDTKKETIWVVLHNPESARAVLNHGGKVIKELYDPVKSYKTIIYEI